MSNSMSVEAEKGPEPWLLKAATFTTFRPFSRPFNLKMASVAKGSSMLKTFEWVPLPQLTKICKEKDSIYPMGCAFFFFTHPCHDPILAFIGWKWTPKGVRFLIKKATKKTTTRHEHPVGNLQKKSYAWKRACLQAGCYNRKLFYLLRQNYRISWSPLLLFYFCFLGQRK